MAGCRVCQTEVGELLVPENDWMLAPLLAGDPYEPYVLHPLLEHVIPQTVMLDIGANIGLFSVAAAKCARKVIAVEPGAENAKLIAANGARQGLRNIEVLPIAASDRVEMATFLAEASSDKVVRPMALSQESLASVDVAFAAPLDLLIHDPVDLIKIDIEGREYAALQGMTRILDRRPLVFIEFSPDFMRDGCGVGPAAFLEVFFGRGYEATILHRDMRRERVGQDIDRLLSAWADYMGRQITHLDLMFSQP